MLNGESASEKTQQLLLESHELIKKNTELFNLKYLEVNKKKSASDIEKIQKFKNEYGIKKLFETPGAKILGICGNI